MFWLLFLDFLTTRILAEPLPIEQLRYVAVLFRHGERGPLFDFSSNKARSHFKNKTGQLTEKGKQQATQFGEYLNKRYYDGKGKALITKIHSTNKSRCLESGELILKTIFPENSTILKPKIELFAQNDIDWVICIYEFEFKMIKMFYVLQLPVNECQKQVTALKKWCPGLKNASDYVKYDDLAAELLMCTREFKSSKFFTKSSDIVQIEALVAEVNAGLIAPTAETFEAEKIMQGMHELSEGYGAYVEDVVAKTSSGQLISILYNEVIAERNETLVHFVSTQDWIIASSMQILGVSDFLQHRNPPYLSSLTVEAWGKGERGKIKIFYQMLNATGTIQRVKELALDEFTRRFSYLKDFDVKEYCKE
ncbi:unnamed protein product, partial [Mesorhabditis belari]|uniref:Uncharacterized protein n=1 Tax=Mesorhabditis belari TaxID=2138241 RepID=A0AAF3E9V2_9BILA